MAGRTRKKVEKATGTAADAAVTYVAGATAAKMSRPATRRLIRWVLPVFAALAGLSLILPGSIFAMLTAPLIASSAHIATALDDGDACVVGGFDPSTVGDTSAVPDLSGDPRTRARQVENAATIIAVGKGAGVPPKGWVVALATAMQESTLLNLDYGDRDSLGLFQQRPSTGWGTPSQVTDPVLASKAFYGVADHTPNPGLLDIDGWQDMAVTEAAQAVQRSAFPLAYARWETMATALVTALEGVDPGTCVPAGGGGGTWGWPLDPLPAVSSKYGMRLHPTLGYWKLHDGTDYGAACGTPLLAVGPGTVTSARYEGGYGNTVRIDHGDGVATGYAHMSAFTVTAGDTVTAGQVIGKVGTTGYSTGCHLHLMVHINGSPTDPEPWLKKKIAESSKKVGDLGVGTYNVLYTRSVASIQADLRQITSTRGVTVWCLQEARKVSKTRIPAGWKVYQPQVQRKYSVKGKLSPAPSSTPIMYNTSTWRLIDRAVVPLTKERWVGEAGPGPGLASRRDLIVVRLAGDDGASITVGCTHYTSGPAMGGTRLQLHREQVRKTVDAFGAWSGAKFVAGDFNSPIGNERLAPLRRVARPGYTSGIDTVFGAGVDPVRGVKLGRIGSDHQPVGTWWKG